MIDRIAGVLTRVLLVAAFILGGLALWEKLANVTGHTLVFLRGYQPARLIEMAVVVLVFAIALELRAIMKSESAADGAG